MTPKMYMFIFAVPSVAVLVIPPVMLIAHNREHPRPARMTGEACWYRRTARKWGP